MLSKTNITLKIKTEKGQKNFDILGKETVQQVRINLKAKMFEICFEGNDPDFLLKTSQFVFSV